MNKNIKKIFLLTTLVILLVGITAVNAVDADNTNDVIDESISLSDDISQNDVSLDNKDIQTQKLNVIKKAPETSVDYYVSDADGNDENDGSQQNPFKTVQTAIDKTDSNNNYNIHISEGIYKGEGNTNLTVPGDNYINIIGSGINKTIFDGEAKFDIQNSGFYWGSSNHWFYYQNGTGNWIMNVTAGSGLVTIKDFTIQHAWSNGTGGGSGIGLYPEATVDNYGTLNASNIYFYNNYAGVGAGIRNNPTGLLYVNNCIFDNQTKSVSTGNYGSAIYNNGTAYVTGILVNHNYARWGSVTNDKTLYIYNSTFKDGIGYDGNSAQKNGPSIYVNTGNADFFAPYDSEGLVTLVENCTFINNQQCDINLGKSNVTVNNCIFNGSTGIYVSTGTAGVGVSQNFTNNKFINIQDSTMFVTMLSATKPAYAIYSLANYNTTIENNTIDVPNTEYGYGVYVTANALIKNNTLNNEIRLNGQNNTVVGNVVNSETDAAIRLSNSALNTLIKDNELYSSSADGEYAIANILASTNIENNLPEVYTYIVTNGNYSSYFNDDATAKTDVISNGSKIILDGTIVDKDFIFDNVKVLVEQAAGSVLINSTIISQNNAKVALQNIKINNTKNDKGYVILFNSTGNLLKNSVINATVDGALQVVKIEEDSNTLTNVTINATAPAFDTQWNADYSIGTVPTAGIFIRSSDNLINNSKLYLNASVKDPSSYSPSVDGVDIQSKGVGEIITGNELRNTRINVTGGSYVYGLNIARAEDTYTTLTYYDVTSNNYACGIQIGDSKNNDIAGYVYAKADSQAYGAYITAMATGKTYNTNFSKLYIQNITAPESFGISLDGADGVELSNATYTLNGNTIKVISIQNDWMSNTPENIFINALKITSNSASDDSEFITVQNTNNITITNSNMTSTSGKGITLTNVTEATVKNNFINAGNLIGGNEAVVSNYGAVIENNTPVIALLTDETYSNFFDENGILIADVNILSLAGDIHNKDFIINKNFTALNFTNSGDYTIYNGTIIRSGISTTYNSTYGNMNFNIIGVNFNNTNKPIFKDELNGTNQRNVKFVNNTIYATGDDIVVFDAYNNNTYIYLDISYSNITAEGKNVVVVDYSGYNAGQPLYLSYNNINVNAQETSKVINTNKSTVQFNYNNVTQKSPEAITADVYNSSISYSSFVNNNINVESDNAIVLNFFKSNTYIAYVQNNNITVTTNNPTTVINVTGNRATTISNNNIVVSTANGDVPVIYSNQATTVSNNYILTADVAGNDAVVSTGTVSGNTPTSATPAATTITVEDATGIIGQHITVTATVKDAKNNNVIRGNVIFTDNHGVIIAVVDVVNGEASVDVTYNKATETTITAKYNATTYYQESTTTANIIAKKSSTNITINPVVLTAGQTVELIANIVDENGNNVNGGKAVFKVNGMAVKDANGKIVYAVVENGQARINYTVPANLANKNVTINVKYAGTSAYEAGSEDLTLTVASNEPSITIDPLTDAKVGSTITIKANIFDANNNPINGGKVALKINGKTLKDANGKVIYATIVNGQISVDYDLGSLKTGTYTISATLTSSTYGRIETNTTINVIN